MNFKIIKKEAEYIKAIKRTLKYFMLPKAHLKQMTGLTFITGKGLRG